MVALDQGEGFRRMGLGHEMNGGYACATSAVVN